MSKCTWDQNCIEPAGFTLSSVGPLERVELLCVEHASRMRDNLLSVGCTVTITALDREPVAPFRQQHVVCQNSIMLGDPQSAETLRKHRDDIGVRAVVSDRYTPVDRETVRDLGLPADDAV